jgi:hypothetical protein
MALRANDAYAGDAEMPNGRRVTVFFLDRASLVREFGKQPPPGHPDYRNRRRVGWYWRVDYGPVIGSTVTTGPFTSSRRAMMDALKNNPQPVEPDHVG